MARSCQNLFIPRKKYYPSHIRTAGENNTLFEYLFPPLTLSNGSMPNIRTDFFK